MMILEDLEKTLSGLVADLKPAAEVPAGADSFNKSTTFDRSETDNSKWIELALQYGKLKDDDWKYGKNIVGDITPQFVQMLLSLPKPTGTEIENKMTPFFNVFLDDNFQSCHYGTENYYQEYPENE